MTNPVGGFPTQITPALVVDTSAYTAGDVVGGAFEIVAPVRHGGASTVLHTLLVRDAADQDAGFDLLIFDSEPSQTYTDNDACPTLDADIAKLITKITIAAADYVTTGGLALNVLDSLGRILQAAKGGTSLWGVLVTTTTPTYSATDDLDLVFGFLQS